MSAGRVLVTGASGFVGRYIRRGSKPCYTWNMTEPG